MVIALLLIAGFQVYWVNYNYRKQRVELEGRTHLLFRDMLRSMQDSVLETRLAAARTDTLVTRPDHRADTPVTGYGARPLPQPGTNRPPVIRMRQWGDSIARKRVINILRVASYGDSSRRQPDTAFFMTQPGRAVEWKDGGDSILHGLDPDMVESINVSKHADSGIVFRDGRTGTTDGTVRIVMKSRPQPVTGKALPDTSSPARRRTVSTITLNNSDGHHFVIRVDSVLAKKLPAALIRSGFDAVLAKEKIPVPYTLLEKPEQVSKVEGDRTRSDEGLYQPYSISMGNAFNYLLRQIRGAILFSVFLVALTVFSFFILYRSLLRQARLAKMRNDLVSNITHELKTPIATVGVAIEALKNFNAMDDSRRTEEYLDISKQELQRLGLLVDKVLKLSMFETEHIRISQEGVDLGVVVTEVTDALRLQLGKQEALLTTEFSGDAGMRGDRHHLTSVVFNLVDNAMKYSNGKPEIHIRVQGDAKQVILSVADKGIGIPAVYRTKVFDKFFRVPQGDTHNARGHGLGLSYVAEVVRQHGGRVELDSRAGEGSIFTIVLPKNQ